MILTIVIGLLFLAVVFFHYLQGFFSSTLSAIFAVIAAALAFSLHEQIVEKFLAGKAANTAHAMMLVVLFASIYLLLRTIFDHAVPGGVSLPAALDRVGGAVMGLVAATFGLGIMVIAMEEMPFGTTIMGYSKYDTTDTRAQVPGNNGRMNEGTNYDELKFDDAGQFKEADRLQVFPIIPAGVDELVVGAVSRLSEKGSLQGSQPLNAVHPDFLQELFGQQIGIQGGTAHVMMNLPSASEKAAQVEGVFAAWRVRYFDGELPFVRGARQPVLPLKKESERSVVVGKLAQGADDVRKITWYVPGASPTTGKEQMLAVVRVSFGPDAMEADSKIRFSPGSIRIVARSVNAAGSVEPRNYYPIGTLEHGSDGPVLFADKLDDYLMVTVKDRSARPTVDFAFAVDKAGFLAGSSDQPKVAEGVFIEIKRMVRQELGGKPVITWAPPPAGTSVGVTHQRTPPDI